MLTFLIGFDLIINIISKAIGIGKEIYMLFFKRKDKPSVGDVKITVPVFAPSINVKDKDEAKEMMSYCLDRFSSLLKQVEHKGSEEQDETADSNQQR